MYRRGCSARSASKRSDTEQGSKSENMSSWIERQLSSHQAQLAATALISGVTVASLIYGGQAIRRKVAVEELKASIPPLDERHQAQRVR